MNETKFIVDLNIGTLPGIAPFVILILKYTLKFSMSIKLENVCQICLLVIRT